MVRRAPRLPGFRFETQAPTLPEVMPRMDIAVFVGFTASGPLQIPVAIESETQFAAIFGEDAPLAWDVKRGEQVYAFLAPAVRAFFRNGGQRCWVIRVARQRAAPPGDPNYARNNYFPIPGLARAEFDSAGKLKRITPAFARARSAGSWSDSLRVSSALLTRSLQVNSLTLPHSTSPPNDSGNYLLNIVQPAMPGIGVGDLLKMTFQDNQNKDRYVLFLAVSEVEQAKKSPPESTPTVDIAAKKGIWLEIVSFASLPSPGTEVKVRAFAREATGSSNDQDIIAGFEGQPWVARLNPQLTSPPVEAAPTVQAGEVDSVMVQLLNCPAAEAPARGSVIRIDSANDEFWMTVSDLAFSSSEAASVFVWGSAFKSIQTPSNLLPALPVCESPTFEIWVRKAEEYSVSLSDLAFVAEHERCWSRLPSDEEVYRDFDPAAEDSPATILWRQVGDLFRFPLAGIREPGEVYFPLGMTALAENYLSPVRLQGNELERDGLAKFDAALFLDNALTDSSTESLAGAADFLQYVAPNPRPLTGMHASFPLEEATIVAVPDAVHPGWSKQTRGPLPKPEVSLPPLRPEWWHFLDCRSTEDPAPALADCDSKPRERSRIQPVEAPEWGNFLSCAIRIIAPPHLRALPEESTDGTYTLSWESSPPFGAAYVLEESANPDFSGAEIVYSGPLTSFTLYGRRSGDYYYRVRAFIEPDTSNWSNGAGVRVAENSRWALTARKDYSPDVLLGVQRSLLRLCAARSDLFCVLSLPEHYREAEAVAHASLLKSTPELAPSTQAVSPLGFREAHAFTYGALFHPWLIDGAQPHRDELVAMPPCGAISGRIAERALSRGAWLAPANQPLSGVVALEPTLLPERRLALQEARINLVRQEPRGFVVLDAETLSEDADLKLINVRRLLILLRRQALRLGAAYVFEPNSPSFRRMVERGFTEMLDGMFERGAFAGATASSSYQVVADESLNTAQSIDQGRFIVELRVAPSLPMTFVTIRLTQTSDRSLAAEVR